MVASEQDWHRAREQFVREDSDQRHAVREGTPPAEVPDASLDVGPLAEEFAALAQKLFTADTVHGVLQHVLDTTPRVVRGTYLASITMRHPDGGFTTPVLTDRLAEQIDQVQYAADEGPCVDATRTDGVGMVFCPDLARDSDQWPKFSAGAVDLGMRALLGVGLFPKGHPPRLGALNIYSDKPHGLSSADQNTALLLASHASIALARTMEVNAAELEAAQLRNALSSRDVIGQAKGILMERQGIDAGAAFDVLRRTSQDLNVKLTDIARTLVSRRGDL